MDKPIETAFAPQPPLAAATMLWTIPAARPSGLAVRWSADAAMPTLLPGRVDLSPRVTVRFVGTGGGR